MDPITRPIHRQTLSGTAARRDRAPHVYLRSDSGGILTGLSPAEQRFLEDQPLGARVDFVREMFARNPEPATDPGPEQPETETIKARDLRPGDRHLNYNGEWMTVGVTERVRHGNAHFVQITYREISPTGNPYRGTEGLDWPVVIQKRTA